MHEEVWRDYQSLQPADCLRTATRSLSTAGGRIRNIRGAGMADRGRGLRTINLLFSWGVFENKFRIFKWVRVEGLRWHR